jgi:mRNA interferase RelE/StbE
MHPHLKKRVRGTLEIILSQPLSGKALIGELAGLRSLRVGSLRIIYRNRDNRGIEIIAIGPRERIYEETFRRIKAEKKIKSP